jgi:hypothetical protein
MAHDSDQALDSGTMESVTRDPSPAAPYKKDDKVLRGKNGRLFLANDTSETLLQHSGERRLDDNDLDRWRELLESRVAWLQSLGIPYFFMSPPNAHSVYPADLPDNVPSAAERPIHQLMHHLGETGSPARILYPLDEIVGAKPDPLLYAKTDPHWSGLGAFLAYDRLVTEVERHVELHHVAREDARFVPIEHCGELGFKVEPQQESIELYGEVLHPQAWLVHDNCVINVGKLIITECPEAPPTTCVLIGDSFTDHMLPFLAASFRRLVFAQIPTLDRELVLAERPDVVIGMLNERFLRFAPDDSAGKRVEDFAEVKLAEGAVRGETRFWPKKKD